MSDFEFMFSPSTGGFYPNGWATFPDDAVPVTKLQRATLLDAQAAGKMIGIDNHGEAAALDPPPPPPDDLVKRQILTLESQQTPRRIREALLGVDGGWLADIESQIEALRAQLGAL